ncbi:NAD(P)/FAD-dependent oxidoreductase [Streptomyces telluris]|uniref:NAD(P)/FAD-dependent oxidoreductase n=1 Tax=Streptomyces telluris TaxID=2720021 RepID=A0A9X2LFL0_9ACTN|nr:NAD(P)/FAD-dependent oxidoreductase [Streptomyces telluris]MCQ8770402.1 NAD(P)/FAD-dependent oxidoreductase [Streptomyces telluris]NJP81057.1 NAD(P)/FAD-dependent oxidoreductase [Streptomyces telluris]
MTAEAYDTVIVGGGPAGLNAALYLGRSRRRVALVDSGDARNMAAGVMHNMLTNDGVTIADFRARARAEVSRYGVEFLDDEVITVAPEGDRLVTTAKEAGALTSRTVLYAAGVRSKLPDVPGLAALWGKGVFECPYCHAYEVRDGSFGVYGGAVPGECLAATLTAWTSSLTYLSDRRELPEEERGFLAASGVETVPDQVTGVSAHPDGVAVELAGGRSLSFTALFLHMDTEPRVEPLRPWLQAADLTSVQTDERGRTSLPRLYVAGDLGKNMQQAAMAAASGGLAAMAINADLVREDRPGALYDLPPAAH